MCVLSSSARLLLRTSPDGSRTLPPTHSHPAGPRGHRRHTTHEPHLSLHFERSYRHARRYLTSTEDLDRRLPTTAPGAAVRFLPLTQASSTRLAIRMASLQHPKHAAGPDRHPVLPTHRGHAHDNDRPRPPQRCRLPTSPRAISPPHELAAAASNSPGPTFPACTRSRPTRAFTPGYPSAPSMISGSVQGTV